MQPRQLHRLASRLTRTEGLRTASFPLQWTTRALTHCWPWACTGRAPSGSWPKLWSEWLRTLLCKTASSRTRTRWCSRLSLSSGCSRTPSKSDRLWGLGTARWSTFGLWCRSGCACSWWGSIKQPTVSQRPRPRTLESQWMHTKQDAHPNNKWCSSRSELCWYLYRFEFTGTSRVQIWSKLDAAKTISWLLKQRRFFWSQKTF